MQVEGRNFRGLKEADFNLEKIQLVGGRNGSGKSSLVQLVGALLTGNSIPVRGVKKTERGCLVHSGTGKGSATLTAPEGTTSIVWPKAEVKSEGKCPEASEYAAGLSCILALEAKDRAEVLSRYLESEPTLDDLLKVLKEGGVELNEKNATKLWGLIESQGWDGAHAQSQLKGATLKGQWQEITKEKYGSKKAETWLPEEWETDLEGASDQDLQARVTDARDALESAIAGQAVDEERLTVLHEKADQVDDLKQKMADAEKIKTDVIKAHVEALAFKAGLPPAVKDNSIPCPECKAKLEMVNGKLVKAGKQPSATELKKRQKDIDEAGEGVDSCNTDMKKILSVVQNVGVALTEAEGAAAELAVSNTFSDGVDVDPCRTTAALAESRLAAWKAKTQADSRHDNVVANQVVTKALAADGVRQVKLVKKLKEFNSFIKGIVHESWGVVAIDNDLTASLNTTPYVLLSKSERWRVRVGIQMAMAKKDKSAAVLIDGADILVDKDLRNGLFASLRGLNIPSVVSMSMVEEDMLPDLAAAKLGQSWWMDGGVLVAK
jgi:energy-coupling factor transporter ATP-binding protein EcfA2